MGSNTSKNVRGKHSANPGWQAGNHWVVCDLCGCDIRNRDAMQNWKGQVVCPDDWEQRHPQDFVRGREDQQAAQGLVRPEQEDTFVDKPALPDTGQNEIPSGTFDNTL